VLYPTAHRNSRQGHEGPERVGGRPTLGGVVKSGDVGQLVLHTVNLIPYVYKLVKYIS